MKLWLRRLFLVVSVGGGFSGLTVTTMQLLQSGQPVLTYGVSLAACVAYVFGIYSGVKFIESETEGLSLLSWYHLVQIPVVESPIISYKFTSGLAAYLAFGNHGLSWGAYFGGQWQFALFQLQERTFGLGANFFAVWATWYLRKQLARKRGES